MTVNSPSTEREINDIDINSSYRTTGRYSDRYKMLMQDSPPRENKSPNRIDQLIREREEQQQEQHEKVKNWQRRLSDRVDAAIEQLSPSESKEPPKHRPAERKEPPRYMQATRSYEVRVQTKRADPLGVRTGGISKRVGTSKIPHFKSTTGINAIDEIRSEMAPDDVYIPMAARIKLFERGLGNGANKPAPTTSSSSSTASVNNSNYHRNNNNSSNNYGNKRNGHIPTQPIKRNNHTSKSTENPTINSQNSITREKSTEVKPVRKSSTIEVKPFKFATSDRALHHKQVFKDRLKLWQVKDKEHQKNEKLRELKRKNSTALLNEKSKVRRT